MKFARAAKDVALGVLHGAEFLAGVVVGILEGAWQALVDVFKGAWELVKMAFEVMKAYLTGTLLKLMLETAKKVKDFFEKLDVKQLVKMLGAYIAKKWTSAGWFGKGEFVGQVVGYIALNVLLVVATAGGSVGALLAEAAEAGSDVARAVMALVKVVDVAQNPLKLLEGAGKGVTVSEEVAAKLKQGLVRKGAAEGERELAKLGTVMANKGSRLVHTPRAQAMHELLEEARRANVVIRSDEEAQRLLDWAARSAGAEPHTFHAVTIGDDIFVRPEHLENVRVLREELIHAFQQRAGVSSAEIVEKEIEARLMMIRYRHKWGITGDEIREMIQEVRTMRKTGRY
jgi:hypothetical protein